MGRYLQLYNHAQCQLLYILHEIWGYSGRLGIVAKLRG